MTRLLDDIESGNLDIDAQLNRMNIDPAKYKEYSSYVHNDYGCGF